MCHSTLCVIGILYQIAATLLYPALLAWEHLKNKFPLAVCSDIQRLPLNLLFEKLLKSIQQGIFVFITC